MPGMMTTRVGWWLYPTPPVGPPTMKVVAMTELTIMAAAAKHNNVLAINIADQGAALTIELEFLLDEIEWVLVRTKVTIYIQP